MTAKTKTVDLLAEIDKVWHDLLRLQVALDQQNQHLAVARLSAVATELQAFVGNRVADNVRQEKEDRKIQVAIEEAQRLIKQADEMIKRSEGRGQKRPATSKSAKKKAGTAKVNLGPLDAVILEATLQIIKVSKDEWELLRNKPLDFLQRCFGGDEVYAGGFGYLSPAAYLEKGLFKKALIRIIERYQACFESQFPLPTNARTGKLFKLVQEKIGEPDMLEAMLEVMYGQRLRLETEPLGKSVQSSGAEDQKLD